MSDYRRAEDAVFRYIQRHGEQVHPAEMISALRKQGYNEDMVRTGLWRCLDNDKLILTTERTIKLNAARAGQGEGAE